MSAKTGVWNHVPVARRTAVQAGALGLIGLGTNHLEALRAADQRITGAGAGTAKTVLYIFLSGGLAQHESFDLKPDAPDGIRGEFQPIQTATPGIHICEHLPGLAQRSERWALLRSLTHPTNGHTLGHYYMLTGRSTTPAGFKGDRVPRASDWPSIMSVAGSAVAPPQNNLPPSIVLPERLVHWQGGTIPGNYGGQMGAQHDPYFIEASPYGNPLWRGAYPGYSLSDSSRNPPKHPDARHFQAPSLTLPVGLTRGRLDVRRRLLNRLDDQRQALAEQAEAVAFDRQRGSAIAMLTDPKIRHAFDVTHAAPKTQDRYGANSFGWSLLMAYRLAEAGVPLIQVNLGNNETWDTHGDAFSRLKEKLFPPTDQALCALLDDLDSSGLLETTMIVMAGEFGRTPKLSTLDKVFYKPGRDHWGAVQTAFFAGGGIRGGTVVGSSDAHGAYPDAAPQKPENMAATMYHALGIPHTAAWRDELERPHQIYHADPIHDLIAGA